MVTDPQFLRTRSLVPDKGGATLQVDELANLRQTMETYLSGERPTGVSTGNDYISTKSENNYYTISSATTLTVKSGSGTIHALNILGGTLGAITVYDNTAGSGTQIIPTFTPTDPISITLDESFATGCTVVTASATIINISAQ